jgi:hypothetical protein
MSAFAPLSGAKGDISAVKPTYGAAHRPRATMITMRLTTNMWAQALLVGAHKRTLSNGN